MFATILIITATVQILGLIVAAWSDIIRRLIPDYVCAGVAVFGIISRLLMSGPMATTWSVAIGFGVFLALFLLFIFKMIGGGDVKLLTAMTLGLPPAGIASMFFITVLAGGVLALLHLMMRQLPRPKLPTFNASLVRRVYTVERWRILRHAPLPYGVAIACGGIWTVMKTMGV